MCQQQLGPASKGRWAPEACRKRETNPHRCGFGVGFLEFRLAKAIRFANSYFCTRERASIIDIWNYKVSIVGCENGGSE